MTARDIELFTEMTGDRNPLHYDAAAGGAAAGSAGSSCKAGSPPGCSTPSSPRTSPARAACSSTSTGASGRRCARRRDHRRGRGPRGPRGQADLHAAHHHHQPGRHRRPRRHRPRLPRAARPRLSASAGSSPGVSPDDRMRLLSRPLMEPVTNARASSRWPGQVRRFPYGMATHSRNRLPAGANGWPCPDSMRVSTRSLPTLTTRSPVRRSQHAKKRAADTQARKAHHRRTGHALRFGQQRLAQFPEPLLAWRCRALRQPRPARSAAPMPPAPTVSSGPNAPWLITPEALGHEPLGLSHA